jgi:small subunit ribosomal protein S16
MVRIRLRRMGAKHQPVYRIVVADKESPRDGAFIEIIGMYNPRTEPATIKVQEDRALYWMKVGAQPSDSVIQLFRKTGTADRFERLKKGESPETLLAEAAAQQAATPTPDARTRVGRVAGSKASA